MSGYDLSFVREVPAEYLCPICDCPMRDPVQTKCGHRFCKVCLEKSFTRKRKLCPLDRSHLNPRSRTDIYPDLAISRTILDFIVRCPHHSNGCDWTGELRIVEKHEGGCNFIEVKCLNMDCAETPLRKDLQKHMTQECPKREVICQYCKTRFISCKRQDHFDECTKYPMSCLQRCGEEIPRDKMTVHLEEFCTRTMVDCTYAYVGCALKVQRGALEDHGKENTEAHLQLACKKLEEFQGQLAVNTNNVEEIQASIGNTDPDKSLVSEINDLSGSIRLSNRSVQELRYKIEELDHTLKDLRGENEDAVETTEKEITDLTVLVGRNNTRVLELFNKITQLENNLNDLRRQYWASQSQREEEFEGLKNGVDNDTTRVQNSMYHGFQDLRKEIALIKKSQNDATVPLHFMTVIIVIVCSILCYRCHQFFGTSPTL